MALNNIMIMKDAVKIMMPLFLTFHENTDHWFPSSDRQISISHLRMYH